VIKPCLESNRKYPNLFRENVSGIDSVSDLRATIIQRRLSIDFSHIEQLPKLAKQTLTTLVDLQMAEAEFEKGDPILYTSNNGEIELGTVINVHFDDSPPYYTIRLTRNDKEKVTDGKNLTYLHSDDETPSHKTSSDSKKEAERNASSTRIVSETSMIHSWPLWLATTLLSIGVVFMSYKLSNSSSSSMILKRFSFS
jgi:ATP-dependent Zn protease